MGFFDSIGNVAKGAFNVATAPARFIGNTLFGGDEEEQAPDVSEVVRRNLAAQNKTLTGDLASRAKDYRTKLNQTRGEMYDQAADVGRRGLAQQMAGVNKQANQRGLLYSGLKQGAQAQKAAGYAGNLSRAQQNIYDATENQAQELEQGAINADIQQAMAERSATDAAYNAALQARNNRNGLLGSLFSAGGTIAGSALGKK